MLTLLYMLLIVVNGLWCRPTKLKLEVIRRLIDTFKMVIADRIKELGAQVLYYIVSTDYSYLYKEIHFRSRDQPYYKQTTNI